MITELNPDAFWSRFHVCLERAMKNGGFRTKKDFFTHNGIPYSSYDNAVRLGRIPATDIICRYASLFDVSIDWLLLGDDRPRLTPAQLAVADNRDIEEIALALSKNPGLIGFIKAGLGL